MKRRSSKAISDINVTSLVDVTLVLLIIFIIAAPFMRAGVRVDLPKAINRTPHPQDAILIVIDSRRQVFVNQRKVSREQVGAAVDRLRREKPGWPVLIEGDSRIPYGEVISVMDEVRSAGVENVGLVLELPGKGK